jgi:hypothetical protein
MPRRPLLQAAACTDATLRPRHEHRRTICRISGNARSQDNRMARRWARLPDISSSRLRSAIIADVKLAGQNVNDWEVCAAPYLRLEFQR